MNAILGLLSSCTIDYSYYKIVIRFEGTHSSMCVSSLIRSCGMNLRKAIVFVGCVFAVVSANHAFCKPVLFGVGKKFTNQRYTGKIYFGTLVQKGILVKATTLDTGARTGWHSHSAEKILLITDGSGYYREYGQIAQQIHAGHVIKIPADTKHWISANPNERIGYVSVEFSDRITTKWLEQVSNDEYNKVTSGEYEKSIEAPFTENIKKSCGATEITYTAKTLGKNVLFGFGTKKKSPYVHMWSRYASGDTFYVNPLSDKIRNVTFSAGQRTNWHIHRDSEQIILVISGRGYYQEWGRGQRVVTGGSVINISSGTKHRIASAYNSTLSFVEIKRTYENSATEWFKN